MVTIKETPRSALSRRAFLGGGAAATLGITMSGSLSGLARASGAEHGSPACAADGFDGYGPLRNDPAGLLSLPNGFRYTVVAVSGETLLDSGQPTPDHIDGSVSFLRPGGDGNVLLTNHEIRATDLPSTGVPHLDGVTYDPGVWGGVTTIEVDGDNQRVREYVSLAGTSTNCAGGRSPWGTWLTCEETFLPLGLTKPHGYVFEVDPYDMAANTDPKPIIALGRFEHEAVAVDPEMGTIYETEDATNPHGLFYRWTPPPEAQPLGRGVLKNLLPTAGTLEAMFCRDSTGAFVPDLCVATEPGTTYAVQWKAVPERNPATTSNYIRRQFNGVWTGNPQPTTGRPGGDITRSRKLEGAWWGDGGVYFVASFARAADGSVVQHDGQVWFYDPLSANVRLVLRFAYTPQDQDNEPDGPDNIAVSPYGGVILAEDGEGRQHLVGATDDGRTYFLARNEIDGGVGEMTGPNFTPDKKTLFANAFSPGYVFAITGPWQRQGGGFPTG